MRYFPSDAFRLAQPPFLTVRQPVDADEITHITSLPCASEELIGEMQDGYRRRKAAILFAHLALDRPDAPMQDAGVAGWALAGYVYGTLHRVTRKRAATDIDGATWQGKRVCQIVQIISQPDFNAQCDVLAGLLGELQRQRDAFRYDVLRMSVDPEDNAEWLEVLRQHGFRDRSARPGVLSMAYVPPEHTS